MIFLEALFTLVKQSPGVREYCQHNEILSLVCHWNSVLSNCHAYVFWKSCYFNKMFHLVMNFA